MAGLPESSTDRSSADPKTQPNARSTIARVCIATAGAASAWLLLGLVAATLAGLAARLHWIGDLATHFRVQYTALALISLLLAAVGRRRGIALAAGTLMFWHGSAAVWLYLPAASSTTLAASPTTLAAATNLGVRPNRLRLVSCNVYTANPQKSAVIRFIQAERPDVALFMEVDAAWQTALAELDADFPYHLIQARDSNFGIALFSRQPCRDLKLLFLDRTGVPAVTGQIAAQGRTLSLFGSHPVPPTRAFNASARNEHFAALALAVANRGGPSVVMGDLNCTPWSPHFHDLLRHSGLRDSQAGFGPQRSWPAGNWALRIPIDHILVSPQIRVLDRRLGPDIGSDHLPVIVDIEW